MTLLRKKTGKQLIFTQLIKNNCNKRKKKKEEITKIKQQPIFETN